MIMMTSNNNQTGIAGFYILGPCLPFWFMKEKRPTFVNNDDEHDDDEAQSNKDNKDNKDDDEDDDKDEVDEDDDEEDDNDDDDNNLAADNDTG